MLTPVIASAAWQSTFVDKSDVHSHCCTPYDDDLAIRAVKVERQSARPPVSGHRNGVCDMRAKLRETGFVNRVEWRIGASTNFSTSMIQVEVDSSVARLTL